MSLHSFHLRHMGWGKSKAKVKIPTQLVGLTTTSLTIGPVAGWRSVCRRTLGNCGKSAREKETREAFASRVIAMSESTRLPAVPG